MKRIPPGQPPLHDHKKIGKKFIPPFQVHFGKFNSEGFFDAGWLDRILPEILPFGLLNEKLGNDQGRIFSAALGKFAYDLVPEQRIWFGATSSFSKLTASQQSGLRDYLDCEDILESLLDAFYPLLRFYPDCPLNFLFGNSCPLGRDASLELDNFKAFLGKIADRNSPEAIFMQANSVSVANATEFLFAVDTLDLGGRDDLDDYPDSEKSLRYGATTRLAISGFFNSPNYEASLPWPKYFWQRGLELEKCEVSKWALR